MITRFNPPFRSQVPPQWRGACAAVAGGGPNRATAIVVARLVFTISGAKPGLHRTPAHRRCHCLTQPHERACDARIRLAAAGPP